MSALETTALHPRTLRETLAKPNYSGRIMTVIQRLAVAPAAGDVLELLYEATAAMGAHYAAFVSYIRGDFSHENFRFALACDPRWCFEYKERAPYSEDPWIMYASMNTEPICASEITGMSKSQREVQSLALRYGMASTCVVPAPSSGALSRVGMLAIGSRQIGFFEADGGAEFKVLARSLAMELQGWWVRSLRNEMIANRGITAEDLHLLRFERAGLLSKQVASELGKTLASVDSQWQRLNRKLGTANRTESSRLAAEYGLI
jgi:DNA-binding CsgD family transcriptional regulator